MSIRRLFVILLTGLALVVGTAPAVQADPVVLPKPTIAGTPIVGKPLTVTVGSWPEGSSPTIQWTADGTPVAGAEATTFVPTAAQAGKLLRVVVSGTVEGAPATEASEPTLKVLAVGTPGVRGDLVVGGVATVVPGAWSPGTSYTVQWIAGGRVIATTGSLAVRLPQQAAHQRLYVKVIGSQTGFPTVSSQSAVTAKVMSAASPTRIYGTARVGKKYVGKKGTWMPGTSVSYQWLADGRPVSRATKTKLTVPAGVTGRRLVLRTTGRKAGYATIVRDSAPTPRIQRVGTPKLGGSTTSGKQLTAYVGSWASGTTFTYAWSVNGKRVAGLTTRTITVRPGWKGKRIKVTVTGRQAGFSTFAATSKASAKVKVPKVKKVRGPVAPNGWDCPASAPIKGNADSGIYHVPSGQYYDATNPEECFASETDAINAGYRKSKR